MYRCRYPAAALVWSRHHQRMRGWLATAMLIVGCAVTTGCAHDRVVCAGQCQAPYELVVAFRAGKPRAAAQAALRACATQPSVIRVGPVTRFNTGQWQGRVYTRTLGRSTSTHPLLDCLARQRGVVTVGWPD